MILSMTPMSYDKAAKCLVTEASNHDELRSAARFPNVLYVRSHHTGQEKLFTYTRVVKTGRGSDVEIQAWVFKNAETGIELHILND